MGFVGSHLVRSLAADEFEIHAIVRDKTKQQKEIGELCDTLYFGNICDYDFVRRVVAESEPVVVMRDIT